MSDETQGQATNSEWWTKVEEIYHKARELPAEKRAAFLDDACRADAAIRRQIDVLLQQDENPDSFFSRPAVNVPPPTDSASTPAAGSRLGFYRIEAKIGE